MNLWINQTSQEEYLTANNANSTNEEVRPIPGTVPFLQEQKERIQVKIKAIEVKVRVIREKRTGFSGYIGAMKVGQVPFA